jgi:hypothetical protein
MSSKAGNENVATGEGTLLVSMPSEADLQLLPEDERLMQAAQAAKAAASVQGIVDSLKAKAALITDPKERERVLTEAYNREVEAGGLSKKARILKSGTFQGAAGGAGIGAAAGIGLGTVVGTLVGTVASVPTTALGGLVGSGVGALHGPWIKLGGDKNKGEEDGIVQVSPEAIDSGAVQVDEKTGQVTSKNPEELKQAAAVAEQAAKLSAEQKKQASTGPAEKKRPKKLEVRSNKQAVAKVEPPSASNAKARRKPPKLEVRSRKRDQQS